MIRKTLPVALSFLLFACGSGADNAAPAGDVTATPVDPRVAAAKVVVDANGLAVGQGGEREAPRFGSPRGEVDALLVTAFSAKPEMSNNTECDAGSTEFSKVGPLQVSYQDNRFVGWYLGTGEGAVTSDGIAVGSTMAALRDERPVQMIADSTLEGEFQYQTGDAGMITGFFDGSPTDGKVKALAAGINCFFR